MRDALLVALVTLAAACGGRAFTGGSSSARGTSTGASSSTAASSVAFSSSSCAFGVCGLDTSSDATPVVDPSEAGVPCDDAGGTLCTFAYCCGSMTICTAGPCPPEIGGVDCAAAPACNR